MEGTRRFYSELAQAIQWYNDTADGKKDDWNQKAEEKIRELEKQLPYGSGFDNGSKVNLIMSKPQRIVIDTAFHHMDENGYYDRWTEHQVIVTPCLKYGYSLRITGRNRNQVKDYIFDMFDNLSIN